MLINTDDFHFCESNNQMGKLNTISAETSDVAVIYYKSKGRHLVRTKGKTGTQGQEAKIQAAILGKAAAVSAKLRKAFMPLLPDPKNRKLMYRLNNALQKWLRSDPLKVHTPVNHIPSLVGFSLNEVNPLGTVFYTALPVTRTGDGQLLLQIPAFDSPNPIAPLPFNGQIAVKVMAVTCHLVNTEDVSQFETTLNIFYTGDPVPAQELLLPVQTGEGKLSVVAISVNGSAAGFAGALWN